MDMTYVISSTRFFLTAGAAEEITTARPRVWPHDVSGKVDEAMEATLTFKSPRAPESSGKVVSEIYSDMHRANIGGILPRFWEMPSIEIECEDATIYFFKYVVGPLPLYHRNEQEDGDNRNVQALPCVSFRHTNKMGIARRAVVEHISLPT